MVLKKFLWCLITPHIKVINIQIFGFIMLFDVPWIRMCFPLRHMMCVCQQCFVISRSLILICFYVYLEWFLIFRYLVWKCFSDIPSVYRECVLLVVTWFVCTNIPFLISKSLILKYFFHFIFLQSRENVFSYGLYNMCILIVFLNI